MHLLEGMATGAREAARFANGDRRASGRTSDDAKLIFGTVFSLRNMVRKLGGEDDAFICYRTAEYKLHYYETPSNLRFVLLTDTGTLSMRNVLHQIYINLWVEYGVYALGNPHRTSRRRVFVDHEYRANACSHFVVVKNPLSPVEHKGGEGVKNELFRARLGSVRPRPDVTWQGIRRGISQHVV